MELARGAMVISVMAGVSIDSISELLPEARAVVRAMPNLPAQVGEAMTGIYADAGLSAEDQAIAGNLLDAFGKTVWVESEDQIDAVTAISGSGPAYFFAVVEALASAGVKLGLKPEIAETLARQTAVGAGAMLASDERSASEMRVAVTSPGGTTAAALSVLNDPKTQPLDSAFERATRAAAARAKALSKDN